MANSAVVDLIECPECGRWLPDPWCDDCHWYEPAAAAPQAEAEWDAPTWIESDEYPYLPVCRAHRAYDCEACR